MWIHSPQLGWFKSLKNQGHHRISLVCKFLALLLEGSSFLINLWHKEASSTGSGDQDISGCANRCNGVGGPGEALLEWM